MDSVTKKVGLWVTQAAAEPPNFFACAAFACARFSMSMRSARPGSFAPICFTTARSDASSATVSGSGLAGGAERAAGGGGGPALGNRLRRGFGREFGGGAQYGPRQFLQILAAGH